jgi:hypothetical protein
VWVFKISDLSFRLEIHWTCPWIGDVPGLGTGQIVIPKGEGQMRGDFEGWRLNNDGMDGSDPPVSGMNDRAADLRD